MWNDAIISITITINLLFVMVQVPAHQNCWLLQFIYPDTEYMLRLLYQTPLQW